MLIMIKLYDPVLIMIKLYDPVGHGLCKQVTKWNVSPKTIIKKSRPVLLSWILIV